MERESLTHFLLPDILSQFLFTHFYIYLYKLQQLNHKEQTYAFNYPQCRYGFGMYMFHMYIYFFVK